MYFEITKEDLRDGHSSSAVPAWLKLSPASAEIIGAPMGFPEIYLYHAPDLVVVGTSASEVLGRVRELGRTLTISPSSMSHLLHHGLVPPPHTEWEELWFIGIGATATVTTSALGIEVDLDRSWPYLDANSTGTSQPSTSKFLELFAAATERQIIAAGGDGFLMMSSGKDSVSVAVALAEAGRSDIPCVTYRPDPGNTENEVAAEICSRLGLEHRTLDFPADRSLVEERLVRFFEGSPRPCGDNAQIPYAVAVAESGLEVGTVLDGGGSDLYMGYVPGGASQRKQRYRVRSEAVGRGMERLIPIDSPINYLTRSRVATALPGRTFRLPDTKQFYPESVDTRSWWRELSQETAEFDEVDLSNAVVQIFEDQAGVHLKAHVAAQAFGIEASLPYCDPVLVDYLFNLPLQDRYDRASGVTKILVRQMLLETINYDADAIGKHYFGFDGARFLLRHRNFVLSEIEQCSLWSSNVSSLATSWLDRLDKRPMLHHSLLILFQLSGWHNHSRFLR